VAVLVALAPVSHAASRCVNLIEKHVNGAVLDLSDCDLHDDDLALVQGYLGAHPTITTLDISRNHRLFSNANADVLSKNTTLNEIDANSTMYYVSTDKVLNGLSKIPSLTTLNIEDNNLTDYALVMLNTKNTNLTHLDISNNKNITEAGLAAFIESNSGYRSLNLTGLPASNRMLTSLQTYPQLSSISLGRENTPLDVNALTTLASKKTITELNLTGLNLDDKQLQTLLRQPQLRKFGYNSSDTINDRSCKYFLYNPNLTDIQLNNNGHISDDCLKYLAAMPMLSSLSVNYDDILGDGFKYFINHLNLKTLSVSSYLQYVNLSNISQIKNLHSLTLSNANDLNDDILKSFAANPNLSTLIINNSPDAKLKMAGYTALSQDDHLVNLTLSDVFSVNDNVATLLASNKHLKKLDLSGDRLSFNIFLAYQTSTLDKFTIAANQFDPYGNEAVNFQTISPIPTIKVADNAYLTTH
jgi:hypothetical protein